MNWVLGIDPSGSKNTKGDYANLIGWALFCNGELKGTGELIPDPLTGFSRVRRWLRNKIRTIHISDPDPEITIACESAYYKINVAVFAGLIRVKAHIESVALDSACFYKEISPLVSFQAATGLTQYPLNTRGKRDGTRKPAIKAAEIQRYGLPEDVCDHITDALAIAEAIIQRANKK